MFSNLRQSMSAWIIKKIQRYGPHRVSVLGKTYEISENVFNPRFYYTSILMAKNIKVLSDEVVLDMGTGSGIQAITAGQTASKVIAVDINPEAVRFAKRNIIANRLENRISVIQCDLFSSLDSGHKFNVILFTPPYLEGVVKSSFDHALFDPNKELVYRFFRDAKDYIKPGGYVQMLYSSVAGPERILEIPQQFGWRHSLMAKEKTFTEEFLIYKFILV
ncbi:MAG: tRNA (adenine(22)-N(1))-methyltransferase TrmK [Nitrospirae bacterium]|nr:tRNA (adenine(22)-N(1))-methyltransferase TrmK [Nitrospirota bacterium]